MDMELVIWVLVFVGGYSAVVAWFLGVALRNPGEPGAGEGGAGREPEVGGGPPHPPA